MRMKRSNQKEREREGEQKRDDIGKIKCKTKNPVYMFAVYKSFPLT